MKAQIENLLHHTITSNIQFVVFIWVKNSALKRRAIFYGASSISIWMPELKELPQQSSLESPINQDDYLLASHIYTKIFALIYKYF